MSETQLHLQTRELALLIDAIQDYAIFLMSPEGVIRSWNVGAARTMGYEAGEAIGNHFSLFYDQQALAERKPEKELETAGSEGRVEDEGWRIRKDGTRFWANTIITPLRGAGGEVTGFAKITRDLTDRRETEERLRQSEEMFRLLVASVKDYAIFLLDPGGHIRTWNAGAQRIKGYAPEEIIGHHFSEFYPEEDLRAEKPARELVIAREQGSVEDEGWRIRKDGTRFWANVVITAVFDRLGDLRGFTKVTRDMTERKRADEIQTALLEQREARLQAEEEQRRAEASFRVAQESNRAKDEFLMTLSHELRTPLTSILGWARLLPTMSPDEPAFDEALQAISRSAQLQARLIDDVLDVSRIVSGKLRLSVDDVDLHHLLSAAIDTIRPSAAAKAITIDAAFDPQLGSIVADGTRLHQMIWNLLANAVKFTPRNGRIEIRARRTSSHVQVTVSDSGTGIDPSFLSHVFEPFRQAENPSTRVHGGLGLGLSIVRYLAEAHGGTVTAESAGRDQGATFTVTLPVGALKGEHQEAAPAPAQARVSQIPVLLEGTKILLVDDDDESRRLIRAVLMRAGAQVSGATSGAEALEIIGSLKPELVITDIAMAHMDGYTLAREIRERNPEQKIVALTAFPAGRVAASDAPFDTVLSKPIDPVELVEGVARILSN
ncbi:MAG TPA: PAS domain S-box protein [Thermoanaerobaculia bacterium]|nr:PAS domain S-box protein [Thermoanaerobaculia bacterium]